MVFNGNLSPDPSNRLEENFQTTDVTMPILTSSDSEDEVSYEGYEVLPQDFIEGVHNVEPDDNNSQDNNSDKVSDIDISLNNVRGISHFDEATKSEVTALWNLENNIRFEGINIDAEKEQLIKNAMAGFKLPSSSIPAWAEEIPEEEWKELIINRVGLSNKVTHV